MTLKEFEEWVLWRATDVDKLPDKDFEMICDRWWELPKEIRNKIIKIIYGSEAWIDIE